MADVDGEKIGHVRDLLVDESQRKVRLMEVGHGGILGIGESKVLIPVDAITRVDGDERTSSCPAELVWCIALLRGWRCPDQCLTSDG